MAGLDSRVHECARIRRQKMWEEGLGRLGPGVGTLRCLRTPGHHAVNCSCAPGHRKTSKTRSGRTWSLAEEKKTDGFQNMEHEVDLPRKHLEMCTWSLAGRSGGNTDL